MDKSVLIKNDVHDIARRIRAIDRGYYVTYNCTRHRYEVHHTKNYPHSLALVLPYKQLDIRAVNYVLETRIERLDDISATIEKNNNILSEQRERAILDEASYKAKHLVTFINRGGRILPSYNEA